MKREHQGFAPNRIVQCSHTLEGHGAGNVDGLEGVRGCVPSAVSKRQGVDVACVHIVVGPVCRKVRLGGDGRDHAWCLGSRFLLSPYLLLTPRNCYIADVYPQIKSQLIFGRLLRKYHLSPFNLCCSARAVYFLHGFRKSDMRDA